MIAHSHQSEIKVFGHRKYRKRIVPRAKTTGVCRVSGVGVEFQAPVFLSFRVARAYETEGTRTGDIFDISIQHGIRDFRASESSPRILDPAYTY